MARRHPVAWDMPGAQDGKGRRGMPSAFSDARALPAMFGVEKTQMRDEDVLAYMLESNPER